MSEPMASNADYHYRRAVVSVASPAPRIRRRAGRGFIALASIIAIFIYSYVIASCSFGQIPSPPSASGPTSDAAGQPLTVLVATMGPGDAIYERFGHNAIIINDQTAKTSKAYNYGLFDFEEKNFILNFVRGRMVYWMEAWDGPRSLDWYIKADRSVWLQELNLTPRQRVELRDFLEWNARPENRKYLYDYYGDNCSTRVRDAIDRVVGGQIRQQLQGRPTSRTYRYHTRQISAYNVPLYTGLCFVLGHFVDHPLTEWDECFLPQYVHQYLGQVTITDEQGQTRPLVRRQGTLHISKHLAEPAAPPNWLGWYLAAGVATGGVIAILANQARRRWSRVSLLILATIWALLTGGLGGFVLIVWLVTNHVAAYCNENLLQFSPLSLPLVFLVPAVLRGKQRYARAALLLSWLVLASSILGLAVKVLPMFYQVNAVMIALALPIHLGLAWAMTQLSGINQPPNGE